MQQAIRETATAVRPLTDDVPIEDVVRRAQQGDVAAFETLYRAHVAAIHSLCRRLAGDESAARELVQDVFVRAWERLTSFAGQSSLGTWLHRITVNIHLERLRSAKRDAARLIEADEGDNTALAVRPSETDARMDLDDAIARLPLGARTVLVLYDVEGYSHEEIAQMTGIAAATSRVQLWRARRALMKVLDP